MSYMQAARCTPLTILIPVVVADAAPAITSNFEGVSNMDLGFLSDQMSRTACQLHMNLAGALRKLGVATISAGLGSIAGLEVGILTYYPVVGIETGGVANAALGEKSMAATEDTVEDEDYAADLCEIIAGRRAIPVPLVGHLAQESASACAILQGGQASASIQACTAAGAGQRGASGH